MDRLGGGVRRGEQVRVETVHVAGVQMHGAAQQHLGDAVDWPPPVNRVDRDRQRHVAEDTDFERRVGGAVDAATAPEPALHKALIVYPRVDRLRRPVFVSKTVEPALS
jgi:hypothetical protein